MRSYNLDIINYVYNGLSPAKFSIKKTQYLHTAFNFFTAGTDLVPVSQFTEDLPMGIDKTSFPFPYMFEHEGVTWLITKDSVLVKDGENFEYVSSDSISFNGSECLRFVPHFNDWYVFSSTHCLHYDGLKVNVYDGVIAGANHNDKIVFGNVPFSYGNNFYDNISAFVSTQVGDESVSAFTKNTLMWSSIGSADFMHLLRDGSFTEVDPLGSDTFDRDLADIIDRNEFGIRVMETEGDILGIAPVGDFIIVFQTTSITVLKEVHTESYTTYGFIRSIPTGIKSSSYFYADEVNGECIFVDNFNVLYKFTADGKLTNLNFSAHLGTLGDIVVMSRSIGEYSNVWITDGISSYIITPEDKMFETSYCPAHIIDDTAVNFTVVPNRINVITEPIDFQSPGIKSVVLMSFLGDTDGDLHFSVTSKYDKDSVWKSGPIARANREGSAFIRCAGRDFKLGFTITGNIETTQVSSITVNYQIDDNRFRRGIDVSKINS